MPTSASNIVATKNHWVIIRIIMTSFFPQLQIKTVTESGLIQGTLNLFSWPPTVGRRCLTLPLTLTKTVINACFFIGRLLVGTENELLTCRNAGKVA